MRIINWNISWSNKTENKVTYLRSLIEGKSFVVILQEVKMSKEEPTKKQLYYYDKLCKRYNIIKKDCV